VAAAGARAIGCALTPEITSFRRREWNPLPYEGCVGVDGKVVVHEDDLLVAMLRFGENATIHEHPGETETVVACIEGGLLKGELFIHQGDSSTFVARRED